ncbi:hypothetical protein HMPREF0262_02139 [Clostridium sp. ATCC 29733]|nr:hypothetical protein HMPREF0262_02139 [Clostridium sp. ATCC 29733]
MYLPPVSSCVRHGGRRAAPPRHISYLVFAQCPPGARKPLFPWGKRGLFDESAHCSLYNYYNFPSLLQALFPALGKIY